MTNITAMILAAGRGKRMAHLTHATPKPLLKVAGKSLIEHQIDRLVKSGYDKIVINIAYKAEQIIKEVGFGERWGISIQFSHEGENGLETGGGILHALPLISDQFIVVNSDVWTNFNFAKFINMDLGEKLAHLILVKNPSHNPNGDFSIDENNMILAEKTIDSYTFSGIGCYRKEIFAGHEVGDHFPLLKILKAGIKQTKISAEIFHDHWHDIGTPERLVVISKGLTV